MTFPVVYDANVLYPPTLRHVLIQIAQTELIHARWTQKILDETFRNVQAKNPHIDAERLLRTRELMCEAVPDCLITGYESIVPVLTLPDLDDRHASPPRFGPGPRRSSPGTWTISLRTHWRRGMSR